MHEEMGYEGEDLLEMFEEEIPVCWLFNSIFKLFKCVSPGSIAFTGFKKTEIEVKLAELFVKQSVAQRQLDWISKLFDVLLVTTIQFGLWHFKCFGFVRWFVGSNVLFPGWVEIGLDWGLIWSSEVVLVVQ